MLIDYWQEGKRFVSLQRNENQTGLLAFCLLQITSLNLFFCHVLASSSACSLDQLVKKVLTVLLITFLKKEQFMLSW